MVFTALAVGTKYGAPSTFASGPQGFSENFYAYLSQANNNGSAWAGYTGYLQPNAPGNAGAHGVTFADLLGAAGDAARPLTSRSSRCSPSPARWRARRSRPPASARCAPTRRRSPSCSIGVVVLIGALTFLPAFLLGPVVQSLTTTLF